jgi:predicted nuclease of predicted toxin-antitoxin system
MADMNISPQTVSVLQQEGWDIIRVPEVLPANTSDEEILNFCRQENRAILSFDLDFSMLVALSGSDRPSLITLRLSSTNPDIVTQRVLEVLPQIEEELEQGSAITVGNETVRIRKLPVR